MDVWRHLGRAGVEGGDGVGRLAEGREMKVGAAGWKKRERMKAAWTERLEGERSVETAPLGRETLSFGTSES